MGKAGILADHREIGLEHVEMAEGLAGDIVQITGIEDLVLGCLS